MKDVTVNKVLHILNENIETAEITLKNLEDDLSSIGMDSIGFVNIIVSLEEEFDCEIPDSKLLISEMNTAQKIIDILNTMHEETLEHEQRN